MAAGTHMGALCAAEWASSRTISRFMEQDCLTAGKGPSNCLPGTLNRAGSPECISAQGHLSCDLQNLPYYLFFPNLHVIFKLYTCTFGRLLFATRNSCLFVCLFAF